MTDNEECVSGGCMCGAVRFEARGEPINANYCHCESCRSHTGAPVVALVGYRLEQVTFSKGERRIFESSPGVGRSFCGNCGSPMTWEGDGGDGPIVEILVCTLDEPQNVTLLNHFNHAEHLPWFDTADNLPRYRAFDDEDPYMTEPAVSFRRE